MTRVTCRLTARNRDQLRNPTLGSRVRAIFTFLPLRICRKKQLLSDDKARRVTSNDSIKLFSSSGDKPENAGRAVLTYSAAAAAGKTQVGGVA